MFKKLWNRAKRPAILLAVVGLFASGFFAFGETLSLERLGQQEQALVDLRDKNPLLVYGLAFLIYVCVTGLSLPGAAAMSLVIGWYFGFWRGLVLVSFASTTGATLAFLLSRYLLRDAVQQRFGGRLQAFNEALRREGAFYLFTLRLILGVPFFVINVVMGLTPLRVSTFWWVSQIGMLPGTCVFVFAGSEFPSLQELAEQGAGGILKPSLFIAFLILGVFPLAIKKIVERFRRNLNES